MMLSILLMKVPKLQRYRGDAEKIKSRRRRRRRWKQQMQQVSGNDDDNGRRAGAVNDFC
eukprot:m.117944 g.117944  ORF g.117944 m.117944 type:complete len:59 (+) comp15440_c0_seq1:317-493(+)